MDHLLFIRAIFRTISRITLAFSHEFHENGVCFNKGDLILFGIKCPWKKSPADRSSTHNYYILHVTNLLLKCFVWRPWNKFIVSNPVPFAGGLIPIGHSKREVVKPLSYLLTGLTF